MGLVVCLETEQGEPLGTVEDPKNLLHRILPSEDDNSFQFLTFIDWYGDTVFNRLQMETFLSEWERIGRNVLNNEEKVLLSQIENLARSCQKEPHFYLKFYGD